MTGLGWSILEEGKAEGKAEAILDLLADIGSIPAELSRQIYAEEDTEKLRYWLKLAARADSVEQFVDGMQDRQDFCGCAGSRRQTAEQ